MHEDDLTTQDNMLNTIVFAASSNPETMYYHQAIKETDSDKFEKAIIQELNSHNKRGHWKIIHWYQVPEGQGVIPSELEMHRKHDIKTRKVYKYKARLNLHRGNQNFGVN